MRDHVRFRSDQFAPPDVEPWQVGGERFGYTLALWVSACLGERGFTPDLPVPEAWGWQLGVNHDGRVVRIGCENVAGSVSQWLIWLDVAENGGPLRRLLRRSTAAASPNAVYGIAAAIHSALHANPHTSEIEWFTEGPRGEETDHAGTPI